MECPHSCAIYAWLDLLIILLKTIIFDNLKEKLSIRAIFMKIYIIFLLTVFCSGNVIGASAAEMVVEEQNCLTQLPDELLLEIAIRLVNFKSPEVEAALCDVEHFFSCNKYLNTIIKPMFYASKKMHELKFIKDYKVNQLLLKKYDDIQFAENIIGFWHYAAIKLLDDKEIVVGFLSFIDTQNTKFAVTRHHKDRTLDISFGSSGMVVTDGGIAKLNAWQAVATQSDGKILVGGYSGNMYRQVNVAIGRYNIDGTLDSSFNSDSVFPGTIIIPSYDIHPMACIGSIYLIAVLQDCKILAAGYIMKDVEQLIIIKLNSNGSLDHSFGKHGIVIGERFKPHSKLESIIVQNDGEIWLLILESKVLMRIIKYMSTGVLIE